MTKTYEPLTIGSLRIGFPVTQAALSGYSDWPMRVLARRYGAAYTLCEVMLDRFVEQVSRGKKAKRLLRVTDEDHPCGAQLMGNDPAEFVAAARTLVELGFDAIDVNFACPVRKVLGRQRGGYLLGRPDAALAIVARLRDALPPPVPLTVKMRRGIDDKPESLDRFFAIFDGAFALGAAAVTVHGRTVEQRYRGTASWDFLREAKQRAGKRIVLGSGDLFTAQACLDMMRRTGVDGVTVARGAIGNPWIFAQARAIFEGRPLPPPPKLFEQRAVILEHYRMAEEIYGPWRCGRLMRKFGIRYAALHPNSEEVRRAFIDLHRPEELKLLMDKWYNDDLPGCYSDTTPIIEGA
ncbi:MAG: tRNA-dihydrouridine synthase family protein [Pirellulaceae bacterium]|nr:tRNA-dihydrouridine synthase family protein [Pirellulaceae bacterium]